MKKMSVHIAIVILRYCLAVFDLIPSVQRFPTDVLLQYQITIKQNNMKKIVFAFEVFVMMTLFIWSALMQMMH
jgi:hypothetical protein